MLDLDLLLSNMNIDELHELKNFIENGVLKEKTENLINQFETKQKEINEINPKLTDECFELFEGRLTRKEIEQIQNDFHRLTREYEETHHTLISEERRKERNRWNI